MPRDNDTAKFKAVITIELTPVNRYGDELFVAGTITYSKMVEVKSITNLGLVLDRLSETGRTSIPNEAAPILGDEGPPFLECYKSAIGIWIHGPYCRHDI